MVRVDPVMFRCEHLGQKNDSNRTVRSSTYITFPFFLGINGTGVSTHSLLLLGQSVVMVGRFP